MHNHGANELLALWEAGRDCGAARRPLALLECACPDRSPQQLARLPLGRRNALLLAARQRALGETLLAVTDCPACAEQVELSVSCASLMHAKPDDFDDTLSVGGYELAFRLLNSADLVAAGACQSNDKASALLVGRCVRDARLNGRSIPAEALPPDVVATLAQRLAECDPQAETVFELRCPACEERWHCDLDVAAFFWKELRAHAQHLLDDVHTLACAYGWSEPQILTLSPARRQWYLERVQS